MKLDLLNNNWLEIVFEGRNKSYGAYDLRKSITKNTIRAFIIGTVLFAVLVSIPTLMRMIPDRQEDTTLDTKITAVKMPPKKEKPCRLFLANDAPHLCPTTDPRRPLPSYASVYYEQIRFQAKEKPASCFAVGGMVRKKSNGRNRVEIHYDRQAFWHDKLPFRSAW